MVTFLASIVVTLLVAIPIALAIFWRRRYAVPWWLFCLGIATFAGSQLLHLPLNNWFERLDLIGKLSADSPSLIRTAIVLGLSAALTETLARAFGYWLLFRRFPKELPAYAADGDRLPGSRWQDGVMVGLGHGGIESMGLVAVLTAATVSGLIALRAADPAVLRLAPAQLATLNMQLERLLSAPLLLLVPVVERSLAILLQVILSLLVWSGFKRRLLPLCLGIAILYHALVDASLLYATQFIESPWLLEGILALLLLPGGLWLWRTRPAGEAAADSHAHTARSVAAQWRLFWVATQKELQQQWITKRVLIVSAVFLLFGLGSPLLARFTPELLGSIEGAEQFADLIPAPTRLDSMTQYVKNITQFGFIIALLLGMSSVAGEKERGTIPMILSKPLPRWAFVMSKFAAQAAVYAGGFTLAALGAFYYTMVLFEPFELGPFLFGNLLLLLWLLVFAAVTLLGSTVARTTGAAAGIALVGSVLLLIVGSLPGLGTYLPAGLVAWASQLGLGLQVPANSGAIVANGVIVIICLVTAVAVMETQEL